MKTLLLGMILLTQVSFGQSNFYISEQHDVRWQLGFIKSFEEVKSSILVNKSISIVEQTDSRMIVDIKDLVYNPKNYSLDARALVTKTDDGFTVNIKDISYKPSSSRANLGNAVVGSNQTYQYFCNDWIKRGKLDKDYFPAMENMNKTFTKIFSASENW